MNFAEAWKREICPVVQLACLDLNFARFGDLLCQKHVLAVS